MAGNVRRHGGAARRLSPPSLLWYQWTATAGFVPATAAATLGVYLYCTEERTTASFGAGGVALARGGRREKGGGCPRPPRWSRAGACIFFFLVGVFLPPAPRPRAPAAATAVTQMSGCPRPRARAYAPSHLPPPSAPHRAVASHTWQRPQTPGVSSPPPDHGGSTAGACSPCSVGFRPAARRVPPVCASCLLAVLGTDSNLRDR